MEEIADEKLELHKKLIAEKLENWNGLKKLSIDQFAQTGRVSGSFLLALIDYAESYSETYKQD